MNMKSNKRMTVLFLTPALAFFCLVYLYPIIRTVLMSFFRISGITDSVSDWSFIGLGNYKTLFDTGLFRISMWNLLQIWLIGGIIVMSISLLLAVLITSGIRGKKFFRAVIYLPNIISAVALATMWLQYIYSPRFGMLKSIFGAIGWDAAAQLQWLDNDHKFYSMLLAYCWGMIGYHMLIWTSGIERIPPELFEAARIDGAGKPSQFYYLTLPILKGVAKTNITMWSVTSVGFFVWSQLFSSVTADTKSITPMVYMYSKVFGTGNAVTEHDAGIGAAVGVLMSIGVVAVFALANRLIKNDDYEM